jgi:serine/threonine-protein kinase/endoribonuclease IRE1
MPNARVALPAPRRLLAAVFLAFATAQQQQSQNHPHDHQQNDPHTQNIGRRDASSRRSSPQEIPALLPLTRSSADVLKQDVTLDPDLNHRRKKTLHTSSPSPYLSSAFDSERAVATLAPADKPNPAVRAPPANPATGPNIDRPQARSLQDWEVEDMVLLATVDGSIYARNRNTGKELWKFYSERPMVETTYHARSDDEEDSSDDFTWIVEPNQDGSLYIFVPGPNAGIQKLGLTVKQLAELSPYSSEDSPFVYTAEKRTTLFTLNATDGAAIRFFSSSGAAVMDSKSCRNVKALELDDDDDECEPSPTINLGRTDYVVNIHQRDTGSSVCTIRYFEWTPNHRDRDLQAQYSSTLDNKYIYTRHDGGILALEHSLDRGSDDHRFLYQKKFTSSPVVRIFDVARPQGQDSRGQPLVILPQPIAPVSKQDQEQNIFVNCTESGSWYALSEHSYPTVTDGASKAKCYSPSNQIEGPYSDTEFDPFSPSELVGVHSLAGFDGRGFDIPTLPGPGLPDPPEEPSPRVNRDKDANDASPHPPRTIDPPTHPLLSATTSPWTVLALVLFLLSLWRVRPELFPSKIQSLAEGLVGPTSTSSADSKIANVLEPEPEADRRVRFAPIDGEPSRDDEKLGEPITDTEATLAVGLEVVPTVAALDGQAGEDSAVETPKKKAHRGKRGGWKKRAERQRLMGLDADDAVDRVVEQIVQPEPRMLPNQIINGHENKGVTDVSASTTLNSLTINQDRVLGYGSGGTVVYEGMFEGHEVAIKRMLLQYFDVATQEIKLLRQSDDHPNVIRYFRHEKDQNFLYIAVERCQASLFDLFKEVGSRDILHDDQRKDQRKFEEQRKLADEILVNVRDVLQQLAAGLHHLHETRIIHRDIKPQNILVAFPKKNQKVPRLVISDFGLCRTLPDNASTLVGTVGNAGTVGWKAPELINTPLNAALNNSTGGDNASTNSNDGPAQGVKRAVDIFSLGCLFFYVLTNGSHPFDQEDAEVWQAEREINIKKGRSNFGKLSEFGGDAEEPMRLITWMLAPRPEDR